MVCKVIDMHTARKINVTAFSAEYICIHMKPRLELKLYVNVEKTFPNFAYQMCNLNDFKQKKKKNADTTAFLTPYTTTILEAYEN